MKQKYFWLIVSILLVNCSSKKKAKIREVKTSDSVSSSNNIENKYSNKKTGEYFNVSKKQFSSSLTNNMISPYKVDRKKVGTRINSIVGRKNLLIDKIVLFRLLGSSYSKIFKQSKNTMNKLIDIDIKAKVPSEVALELAISAFKDGKINLSEYYIRRVLLSKSKFFVSNGYTLQGLIYLKENKLPEAAVQWQSALKVYPNNESAALNLGFIALKFGDIKTSKAYLIRVKSSWLAELGLAISARGEKKYIRARRYCNKILQNVQNSKIVYISCALNEMDGFNNKQKALNYLEKGLKINSGPDSLNEKILVLRRTFKNRG